MGGKETNQFILSETTGTVAEIKVTNIYEEKMTTIHYKAVGKGKVQLTTGGDYQDTPTEDLPFYSGDASGAVAMPGEGASFVGWFTDEACTQPVQSVHGVYDEPNRIFKPNANIIDKTEVTYYAKFVTGSIVINRTGAPNQSFVYHVTNDKTGAERIDFYVTVECDGDGKGSTEIFEVEDGTYTIEEITDWSWRYESGKENDLATVTHVGAENLTDSVTFSGGMDKPNWLSGLADLVENIFKGGASS